MSLFYSAKHGRSVVNCAIEYVLDPLNPEEGFQGVIENISESGFCLLTSQALDIGQEITIKSLLYLPSSAARVCWVKTEEKGYRAGLEFI